MAFAYKPKGRNKWLAKFRDPSAPTGWRVKSGYVDQDATTKLAHRLEIEAARRYEGIHVPDRSERRTLAHLREDFAAYLHHKGDTEKHVRSTDQRIRDVAAGCGWQSVRDLDGQEAMRWLAGQRELAVTGERTSGPEYRSLFGVWTTNAYLTALRSFGRWLVARGLVVISPFAGVKPMKQEAGRARPRRVISAKEMGALLEAARSSPTVFRGLTGVDRADLYLTASLTGMRAEELAQLLASHLSLTFKTPTIRIPARHEKARRGAVLPIHADLLPVLRRRIDARPGPLFPGKWAHRAASMLRRDLAAASIPFQTEAGRFDFHALRGYFGTALALAGVPLVAAQKLLRHSTPTLTANVYSKLSDADLAAELGKVTSALTRLPRSRSESSERAGITKPRNAAGKAKKRRKH